MFGGFGRLVGHPPRSAHPRSSPPTFLVQHKLKHDWPNHYANQFRKTKERTWTWWPADRNKGLTNRGRGGEHGVKKSWTWWPANPNNGVNKSWTWWSADPNKGLTNRGLGGRPTPSKGLTNRGRWSADLNKGLTNRGLGGQE